MTPPTTGTTPMTATTQTTGTTPTIGSWIKLPTSVAIEAVFAAGADFVCIDMCNGCFSIESVSGLLAYGTPGPRLVRLSADAHPSVVGQLLDAGADGVVIPHVDSPERAEEFVKAALFPPDGHRGMGSTGRQGNWGLDGVPAYLSRGRLPDSVPPVSIMIESRRALEQLDQLAAVAGVSALLVGSADLGLELGFDADALQKATRRVAEACRQHGLSAAIAVARPADVGRYHAHGFDTFYVSNDATLLARAAQEVYIQARASTVVSESSQ
jgi:2-keto-3-deoxy-L-rhamnonate aldolase RhmA